MLVMNKMNMDLRTYLQKNHNKITWKERIQIVSNIVYTLFRIHEINAIHRDLHSGNVLYYEDNQSFHVSDFGFCGPVDKPLNSVYGNLPYIAPEVIIGRETTFASDIYSIGMLMWEISSGQPPFINYEHNYLLAMNIINGMRQRIIPGTPLVYKELMEKCWNADPTKRPDIIDIDNEVYKMRKLFHDDELGQLYDTNRIFLYSNHYYDSSSRIYEFGNLPEQKNATEEEQEAFPSKTINSFNIDNLDELNNTRSTVH
ncbi:kinase-like protein [Rhizophagus irregularis]|uniref:Kinase-like protein n=1 Tax=Rhizophagus irregularis TaxID=588596 RepID=A0A2N1N078_9GLOM|nr:kinase-like protein [Rhizophagus irregularis]